MSKNGDGPQGPGPHGFPFPLDPATLQRMMESLPPEILQMMGPVQAALNSDDPLSAIETLKATGVLPDGPDAEAMRQNLAGLVEQFGSEVGGLQDALHNLGPMLGRLEGLQEQLKHHQKQFDLNENDEQVINGVLGALHTLSPGPHLRGLLEESESFSRHLKTLLADLHEDPFSQIQAFSVLQKSLQDIKKRITQGAQTQTQLSALLPLLRRSAEIAVGRDHPLAAEFLARCIAVEEALAVAEGTYNWGDFRPRWEQALGEAERTNNVRMARLVAIAMQLSASKIQDFALVAELASRVASLAEAVGDQRTSILSRTEEALAYARSGIPEAGRAIAHQAIAQAESLGVPELRARAQITLGQVLQTAGNQDEARAYLEGCIRDLESEGNLDHYLGRALLALAKTYPDGAPLEVLSKAQRMGLAARDAVVFVPTTLGLADRLASESQTREALSVLVKGRVQAVAMAGESIGEPFDQMAKEFENTWGSERFSDALQAFKEAHLTKT